MTAFVDTNVIIRYLTGDSPHLADRAGDILDQVSDLQITNLVIAEVAHVLRTVYGMPPSDIVDAIQAVIRKENIQPFGLDKAVVIQALEMCRSSRRVNVTDAMLWATARTAPHPVVYSFDRRFPREGIEVRDTPA